MQENKYYHIKLELKYHDTSNGWTFVSVSAWKNSVNVAIRDVGMLLCPHALRSQNNIERIQLRMMCASFRGNSCTKIIFCY